MQSITLKILRDLFPLQQGLRRMFRFCLLCLLDLRDLFPLQQGLRPTFVAVLVTTVGCTPRPISTTTRIKTYDSRRPYERLGLNSETYFHYNKD